MGFIGQYVVEEIKMRGHVPVIFDHHRRLSHEYPDGVEIFQGDILDEVAVTEAMAHSDGWIHLAAVLGTQETINNPRPAAKSNMMGGLNILEAAAQYNLPGSYIAVGNHWMNNTYSITKSMIERFIDMFNKYRGTKVNIVRAVNAYGPRQVAFSPFGPGKVRKITPSFVCRALSNMDVEIYGDGSQISDMVFVADVAKALVNALLKAHQGEVFKVPIEVGPEKHNSVKEVAELIISLSGSRSKIINLPMRPGEIPGSIVKADISTLRLVEMDPKDLVDLKVGMQQTIDYFERYLNKVNISHYKTSR